MKARLKNWITSILGVGVIIFLFSCTAQQVIKIGRVVDTYDTIVEGYKVRMLVYTTEEGNIAEKPLYEVKNLEEGSPFAYQKKKKRFK